MDSETSTIVHLPIEPTCLDFEVQVETRKQKMKSLFIILRISGTMTVIAKAMNDY